MIEYIHTNNYRAKENIDKSDDSYNDNNSCNYYDYICVICSENNNDKNNDNIANDEVVDKWQIIR